jgi:hypothetical protein
MFMRSKFVFFYLAAAVLVISSAASAHHGSAAYETTKSITVKGTVTSFEFVNPHVRFYMDVKDDKGSVEHWQGEMGPPSMLTHRGWGRTSLKPGDEIAVTGHPSKNGSTSMIVQKVVLSNGEELKMGGGGEEY